MQCSSGNLLKPYLPPGVIAPPATLRTARPVKVPSKARVVLADDPEA